MSWETSNRRSELPPDWRKRVAATKARAKGLCEAVIHVAECDGIGRECDHKGDPLDHDDLQWLSPECHRAKTQAESLAARQTRVRPTPPHPGVIA